MTFFTCPVCNGALSRKDSSLVCENRHTYDISRRGYVNLLMSQASSLARHGDSKEMVAARNRFLDSGHYSALRDTVVSKALATAKNDMTIIDIGCGECYYTAAVAEALSDRAPHVLGIDISKEALISGAKRSRAIDLAVASAFSVPVKDNSADLVLNLFAPHCESEFLRITKPGGYLIRVFPLEEHLWELKCAIYNEPYKNVISGIDIQGFTCVDVSNLKYEISLSSNQEIKDLFGMTPYSYKTGTDDAAKLDSLDKLTTRVEFAVITYKKDNIGG